MKDAVKDVVKDAATAAAEKTERLAAQYQELITWRGVRALEAHTQFLDEERRGVPAQYRRSGCASLGEVAAKLRSALLDALDEPMKQQDADTRVRYRYCLLEKV